MKSKLIAGYLLIAVVYGSWSYFFGPTQYHSYAYNLGVGIAWPVNILKGDAEIDGDSDQAFGKSLTEMKRTYPMQALNIEAAIGMVLIDLYAQENPDFHGGQIKALFEPGASIPADMFNSLWQMRSLVDQLKDRLDGMDLDDLLDEAQDARDSLLELADERPEPVLQTPEPVAEEEGERCFDEMLEAFREAAGEDATVSFPMQQEWRAECGLPLEE